MSAIARLEQYTIKRPDEVLRVLASWDDETDEILIFKGFSSSLMRPTASDPDVPIIPEQARLDQIDRLHSPYLPDEPRYIEQGLTWETMQPYLQELGV
ncbi:hypothetical protein NEA10_02090 [Phormidium yuhuli AB48]|uniref:DUF7734 domain-containing protein n=1 Tax=Phormidium yuhuli AB48 TaxID=2940671 RepID=A0ABY5AT84_9CYAN|nr:hypothetical protein [Phormidium yuhuli]USR91541.1 hypothetical protein NEA10_02090 [Phormidium yuhuli AB48]